MPHPTVHEQDPGTEVLDPDWLAAPSHRSRGRVALLVCLAVLLVFLGGVEVQKRWGAADGEATSAGPGGLTLPAGGTAPGGQGSFTSGSGTPTESEGDSTSATPAVIGTVTALQGKTWTVTDLGGKDHIVKVTARTLLTRPFAQASEPVRAGSKVTVVGSTHGRTVDATSVTVR